MHDEKPLYFGHRKRLREKFRAVDRDGLSDYELLELLLSYAIPRYDTKPLAKRLIKQFGSFANVLDQGYDELESMKGLGENSSTLIKLVKAAIPQYFEPDSRNTPVLNSPEKVIDFIRAEIGNKKKEFFMLLCLNTAGRLIHKEIISKGTINQAHVYPREIIKTALLKNSSAIILVHNHPSGNLKPSSHDEKLTSAINEICSSLGIILHDHLIVSKDQAYSIKYGRVY